MLNRYETVFILTPVLSDVQTKEAVDKYTKILKENGATKLEVENWGLKKLAYPIQKKSTGFYYLIEFSAEGPTIEKLETAYRRDERMLRFLTFKMDKDARAYAVKRKAKAKATKKPEAEAPAAAKS